MSDCKYFESGKSDWEPVRKHITLVYGALLAYRLTGENPDDLKEEYIHIVALCRESIDKLYDLKKKYNVNDIAKEIEFILESIIESLNIEFMLEYWDRMAEGGVLLRNTNQMVELAYGEHCVSLDKLAVKLMVEVRNQALQAHINQPKAGTVEPEPDDIITAKVAIADYHITKPTITKQLNKKLTDYRNPDHKQNDEVLLSRSEVERNYKKRR